MLRCAGRLGTDTRSVIAVLRASPGWYCRGCGDGWFVLPLTDWWVSVWRLTGGGSVLFLVEVLGVP